ncbi:hypothetical protein VHEMI02801 [[Torrubiella] hemipterigena]|uniref:N-acetyltransferase domain-containing protein n=1 Tax=[Torrubiella] hemipterigena TaxID=1531966 RepID=A0A0A1SQR2_9HYPO|nr:hypothetical protein VHEMI02801 [[Torrubiella] hemipterigena]
MASSKPINVSIEPLNYADISTCAQIAADSFATDPHTIVKQLGKDGYDMADIFRGMFLRNLERKTIVHVKAVDQDTGKIVGHGGWAFPRVDPATIPRQGPSDEKPAALQEKTPETAAKQEKSEAPVGGRIDELHALEDKDMQEWMTEQVPSDKPCMIIACLMVHPEYQSRGVGSALIQHGNKTADQLGLSIYVHSSDQAWKAYSKFGFTTMRELDIDLDEYAPRPPRDDEHVMGKKGIGKWGKYMIRYMVRTPVKASE